MNRMEVRLGFTAILAATAWTILAKDVPQPGAPRALSPVHARPAADTDGRHQAGDCPRGAPGAVLWSIDLGGPALSGAPPAVAEDGGTVYVGGENGSVRAVACSGQPGWRFDTALQIPARPRPWRPAGAPVVGDTGLLYLAVDATGSSHGSSMLFAVGLEGALAWTQYFDAVSSQSTFGVAQADDGRVVVGATGLGTISADFVRSVGVMAAYDAAGQPRPGLRMHGSLLSAAPISLADGRTVFASNAGVDTGFIGPGAAFSPAYLPWASGAGRTVTATAGPSANGRSKAGADAPRDILLPPRLHIFRPGLVGEQTIDVGPVAAGTIVAAPGMIVMDLSDLLGDTDPIVHRLAAISLEAPMGRPLWQHVMHTQIAGAPLIGRRDPRDGGWELVYLTTDGTLVSLKVPGDPASTTAPTFNWARTLDGRAAGAPVLGDAGFVYAAAGNRVAAIRRSDGSDGWSVELAPEAMATSLMLAPGGLLYAGTQSGELYAIATESGGLDPDAAWPAPRHDSRNTGRAGR